MPGPRRTDSQESHELKTDVDILKGLLIRTQTICMYEYFQLLAVSYIDKNYSFNYLGSTMHDSVELGKLSRDMNSKDYRNRNVWESWHYIRPLVTKYISSESEEVTRLDRGLASSATFWFRRLIGDVRSPARSENERPQLSIFEARLATIDLDSLNNVLDDISVIWGFRKTQKWDCHTIFNPQRLHGGHGPMTSEPVAVS